MTQDPGADRRPELDEPAVSLLVGSAAVDGRDAGGHADRPGRRPRPAPSSLRAASMRSSDSVASLARSAASSDSATRRASSSLVGPVSASRSPRCGRAAPRSATHVHRHDVCRPRAVAARSASRARDAIAQDGRQRDPAAATCPARGTRADRSTTGGPWPSACTWARRGRARPRTGPWVSSPHSPRKPSIQPVVSSTTDRRPAHVAARPDDEPVAARVVDERDAQGRLDAGGEIARDRPAAATSRQNLAEPFEAASRRAQGRERDRVSRTRPVRSTKRASRPRRRSPDGRRRRTGSDRPSDGAGRRRRSRAPRSRTSAGWAAPPVGVLEDDEGLLEVGLVVVGTEERGAPVVHAVEEQVVEDDPAIRDGRRARGTRPAGRASRIAA